PCLPRRFSLLAGPGGGGTLPTRGVLLQRILVPWPCCRAGPVRLASCHPAGGRLHGGAWGPRKTNADRLILRLGGHRATRRWASNHLAWTCLLPSRNARREADRVRSVDNGETRLSGFLQARRPGRRDSALTCPLRPYRRPGRDCADDECAGALYLGALGLARIAGNQE